MAEPEVTVVDRLWALGNLQASGRVLRLVAEFLAETAKTLPMLETEIADEITAVGEQVERITVLVGRIRESAEAEL